MTASATAISKHKATGRAYAARRRASLRAAEGKGNAQARDSVCVIVHDPDKLAGFAAGAQLGYMLQMLKVGSFTENTILKVNGHTYRVTGEPGYRQYTVQVRLDRFPE